MGANGSIQATNIGLANSRSGYEVIIQSLVDFSAAPGNVATDIAADINALSRYLALAYHFNGGTTGLQNYSYATSDAVVSSDGSLASIVKHVPLIP